MKVDNRIGKSSFKRSKLKWALFTVCVLSLLLANAITRTMQLRNPLSVVTRVLKIIKCNISKLDGDDAKGIDSQDSLNTKIIYGATLMFDQNPSWSEYFSFEGCEFSNCLVQSCISFDYVDKADLVIFHYESTMSVPVLPWTARQHQLWVLLSYESPARYWYSWTKSMNGKFNLTMTYRQDSTIHSPYGFIESVSEKVSNSTINYSKGKVKGAFAYVSNCNSQGYDRLETMMYLKKYINVDVYGGCTGVLPCARGDYDCETKTHSQYRFFLSFENSLCKDYITEKFWKRLSASSHFVPVAIGGLSLEDYSKLVPPDSYLHAYNFTSLDHLGKYLKHLMYNDSAYNSYHTWRDNYRVSLNSHTSRCRLCELANTKPNIPAKQGLDTWFNADSSCRKYNGN